MLVGIGHSCCLFAGIVLNNKWFLRRRSITSAMANSGSAVGPFLLAPLWGRAVRGLGWRSLLRVLGACDLLLLLCASLVLTPPPPPSPLPLPAAGEGGAPAAKPPRARAPVSALEVLRNREVRRIALVIGVYGLGSWVPVVHLVSAARDQGFARGRADGLVLLLAVGSVCLRVPVNALADRYGRQRAWIAAILLNSAADIVLPSAWGSYPPLCAYAVLAGGLLGALNSLMVTLAPEVCGRAARVPGVRARS